MKRLLTFLILLFSVPLLVFALSAPQIYFASDESLRNMAQLRGLEGETREELQNALYDYEGLDAYSVEEESSEEEGEEGGYVLTINEAQNFTREGDRVILTGNASIEIDDEGVISTLSADTIIIDTQNKRLTALENVVYSTDDESSSIQDISADVVTVTWERGDLMVTNATTSTESTSEDETITIYTSGETQRDRDADWI